jgi:hypothetical protein
MPVAATNKMGLLVWSPLAGGYLSGKYSQNGETTTGRQRASMKSPRHHCNSPTGCNASMTGIASPDDWQGVGDFAWAGLLSSIRRHSRPAGTGHLLPFDRAHSQSRGVRRSAMVSIDGLGASDSFCVGSLLDIGMLYSVAN